MLQENTRKFAQERIKPLVARMDEENQLDDALLQEMFANGFMGVEIDDRFGGAGMNFTSAIVMIEELAKIDPAVSVVADVQNTLVNNMFRFYGSEEQKEKYLSRLATDTVGCFCLSEESSGSDAFALKASAKEDGDSYILNGNKMWITNSGQAGIFLVMANLDPSKGYKGITCFIVEKDMPGLSLGKKEDKLGIRASSTHTVQLDNVRVPKENVLGEIGRGYKYAIEILNEGRIGIGAQMIGLAQGAFEAAMPYMKERKQFGTSVMDFQGMKFQYGQIATDIEAGRLLVYNAARKKDAGEPFVKEAAMAKLYASQIAERTASRCVEWVGGVGFTKEFPLEKFYRDCKIGAIYEGTTNIQLQTIANLVAADYK